MRVILAAVLILLGSCVVAATVPSNYERAIANVLVHEGGYSNHPRDPGGVTLHGVIQRRYDQYRDDNRQPRRALTPAMAKEPQWIAERNDIYNRYYATPCAFPDLPAGLDYTVLDYCVNSGIGRGGKALRCAVVTTMPMDECMRISRTWQPSPEVIAVANQMDRKSLIRKINDERIGFLKRLSTWSTFGGGWNRRVTSVRSISIAMAEGRRADGLGFRPMPGPGKAYDPDEDDEVSP